MARDVRRSNAGARKAAGFLLAALFVLGHPLSAGGASAQGAAACTKTEFEDVVDGAAAALRDLNNKNRPEFQEKLRQLKEKRAWDNDQFLKEAAPFVKDDQIDVYDETSNELLGKITDMGQEGAAAATPDCTVLAQLRDHMNELVGTQIRKWTYMFDKLDKELAK
jgi:hypothetical protein